MLGDKETRDTQDEKQSEEPANGTAKGAPLLVGASSPALSAVVAEPAPEALALGGLTDVKLNVGLVDNVDGELSDRDLLLVDRILGHQRCGRHGGYGGNRRLEQRRSI